MLNHTEAKHQRSRLYTLAQWVVGPAYIAVAIASFMLFVGLGWERWAVAYGVTLEMAIITQLLELALPYEKSWRSPDDQLGNEIGHMLISATLGHGLGKATAYLMFSQVAAIWAGDGAQWWPRSAPLAVQVALAFVVWEFGLYWNHRFLHGRGWRFHVLHHKLRRLSWINSGYGHPLNFFFTSLCSFSALALSGAPADVLKLTGFLAASINLLSHANIDMKMGVLNYVFNTPEVHRWHHDTDPRAHGRNFGTQLIVWDLVFGTYYLPADRQSPRVLGELEDQPAGFLAQWLAPFASARAREWRTIPATRQSFRFRKRSAASKAIEAAS